MKVEISLDSTPPSAVIVRDTQGFTVKIDVTYPRLPPRCSNCTKFGHLRNHCPRPLKQKRTGKDAEPPDGKAPFKGKGKEVVAVVVDKDTSLKPAEHPLTVPIPYSTTDLDASSTSTHCNSTKQPLSTPKKLLKSIGHRIDNSKRLNLGSFQLQSKMISASSAESPSETSASERRSPALNHEDAAGFIPAPATLKRERWKIRQNARLACASPSLASPSFFSALRAVSNFGGSRKA